MIPAARAMWRETNGQVSLYIADFIDELQHVDWVDVDQV
jgi:hypothetical protein